MSHKHQLCLAIIAIVTIAGLIEHSEAQVPAELSAIPPGGSPRSKLREALPAFPQPAGGRAAANQSTIPGGLPPLPTGVGMPELSAPIGGNGGGAANPPPQYWSPSTALWSVQQRFNVIAPAAIYGEQMTPGAATTGSNPQTVNALQALIPSPGVSEAGVRPSELPDSQAAGRNRTESATELPPALRAAAEAAGNGQPFAPITNQLDIPFDQFETFEEFDAWLKQQLASPGGGMLGDAATANSPWQSRQPAAQRNPASSRSMRTAERPPIGYIGMGSSATTQLGSFNFGPDVAAESARLVDELNRFLGPSQRRGPARWAPADDGPSDPPLPRSSLGRRSPSQAARFGTAPAGPNQNAPATGGFNPQAQPRQYWQNLGGYQPPTVVRPPDWP